MVIFKAIQKAGTNEQKASDNTDSPARKSHRRGKNVNHFDVL